MENLTLYLRLDQKGQECPSLEKLIHFLSCVPYEYSQKFFMSLKFLMETMTSQGIPFGVVMESFVTMDDQRKRRIFVDDDVPPPIPGIPMPSYSLDLWRLLKKVYQFQSSLRPVTLRDVLSSRNVQVMAVSPLSLVHCDMMVSPSAQYGFYLRCVMHGSNPRLQLATVSPGMFYTFLRKFLANAAESGQNCSQIKHILAIIFGLNRRMLQMMLQNI